MIAEVAFQIPLERSFHYLIPSELEGIVQPGMRVLAPFGRQERLGFVLGVGDTSPIKELKTIRRLIDPTPVISHERWTLAAWFSTYYCCSLGEALATMVPTQLRLAAVSPHAPRPPGPPFTTVGAGLPPRPASGDGRGGLAPLPPLLKGQLSADQRRALSAITATLKTPQGHRMVLLHGVTGSGKTEIYLHAIHQALALGRSAICLVPEIALTPQTLARFRDAFGEHVAAWHSRLTLRQRASTWRQLTEGTCRVVVGTRSAVFAPLQTLGLIILDEEHDQSYKQGEHPRYHARTVALTRASLTQAAVLLGSATPSVESYYAATHKRGRLVSLPQRVQGRSLPQVDVIDMRQQWAARRRSEPLSPLLQRALEETLASGEQAMLLLNRRGFARVVRCHACGLVARCARCTVPLVYHASRRELICHYCRFHQPPPEVCQACRKGDLRFRGAGTERVESELHRYFPTASIARMDRDTTTRRGSHDELYEAMKAQQIRLLVGTQMIAKGFDFPHVTLVGVVSADTALNLPDFRAGERTFDLLTQVAGRAGRGVRPGRVLIQTFCPSHYAIQAAARHDYHRFYHEEIGMRRRLRLPPFTHLVELTLQGSSSQRVQAAAEALAVALRRAAPHDRLTLLGPAPHRLFRRRQTYRMCLLLKGRAVEPMVALLRSTLQAGRRFQGMPVAVDVDPL
ncbi:MAG: primosomal protein N' [Candidatus Omnitrophota bacterium]|nr:primosomal protein N' [Candidatus Omnitrophota bacterium]